MSFKSFEIPPDFICLLACQLYQQLKLPLCIFVSYVQPVTQQNKYLCNQRSYYKKYKLCTHPDKGTMPINYHLKSEVSIMIHCQLCMFNLLHSRTNQELFKSTSVIKVATMKLRTISIMQRKTSRGTAKLTLFTVSKDK